MEEFDLRKYIAENVLLREDPDAEKWEEMDEDERREALLNVVNDPDEAEELINKSFYSLPDEIEATIFENQDDSGEY